MEYLPRLADAHLERYLRVMGAVLIEGVKGCGKTATARRIAASEVLLDVDPDAARRAEIDPRLLLEGPQPRLLDEWQRAPVLWDAVRRGVDDTGARGQYVLTGSATPRRDIERHSDAGRFGVLRMRTLTLSEQRAATPSVSIAALLAGDTPEPANCPLTFEDYLRLIAVGGWPFLVGSDPEDARIFLDGYLDTIAEQDIAEVSEGPRDPRLVRRFLHGYAQMTAQPANLSAIVRRAVDSDDSANPPVRDTARRYLDALRRMMIVDEIPAWEPAVRSSKRLISTGKRHLADPSLAATLLGLSPTGLRGDLETTGFLFESLVAHDLRVYAGASQASCFHYREAEGRLEIDYVLETYDGEWIGVEVKLGGGAIDRAASSLLRLAERVRRRPKALVVVTATSLAYTRDDGVHVVPLGCLGP